MIIFIKHKQRGLPLEIEATATLEDLHRRVQELCHEEGPLVYAGKVLPPSPESLESRGIREEATIHLMEQPKWTIYVTFQEDRRAVTVPNSVTIRDLKREVRNVFSEEASFARSLPALKTPCGKELNNALKLTACLKDKGEVNAEAVKEMEIAPLKDDTMDADRQADLLASFVSGASSSFVEVVFCFDTTGSMASCIAQVTSKLNETINRLLTDIPNIRIGVIAHGDYCDQESTYVIKHCDLTNDLKVLSEFMATAGSSGGGDFPECYELALRTASEEISWTEGYSKALVVIGDAVPHPPSFTTEAINWFDELDHLAAKEVKVYGVRALDQRVSIPFYEEMAERTGAISIQFSSFHLIVDMFLAICYRESSADQLQKFEEEMKNEGKMNKEMESIFESLAKPNCEIPKEKSEKKKKKNAKEEKEEKEEKIVLKSNECWYDLRNDANYKPSFEFNKKTGKWVNLNYSPSYTTVAPARSYTPTATVIPGSFSHCGSTRAPPTRSSPTAAMKMVVVGDGAVGKTSMLIRTTSGMFPSEYVPSVFDNYTQTITVDGKSIDVGLWDTAGQEDYDRLRPLSYPQTDIFLVCFSVVSPASFQNLDRWFAEINHHCPGTPAMIVGTKTDLRDDARIMERLEERHQAPITALQGKEAAKKYNAKYMECSSLTGDNIELLLQDAARHVNSPLMTRKKKQRRGLFRRLSSLSLFGK